MKGLCGFCGFLDLCWEDEDLNVNLVGGRLLWEGFLEEAVFEEDGGEYEN